MFAKLILGKLLNIFEWNQCHFKFWKLSLRFLFVTRNYGPPGLRCLLRLRGERHFKIRFWNFLICAQFTSTNLPNFEKIEKVWQSGKFWPGDWKSMKIWQILTRRLKKYENLACEALEGSTRFSYFFCHVYEG